MYNIKKAFRTISLTLYTLDVKLIAGENVKYVTYPAKLRVVPGGYLHLMYDGLSFIAEEASFSSEQGTVDIFGTIFQVDKVNLTLVDSQNLLGLEGIFFKRAPDGSMITLTAVTSNDLTKPFMERLQLNLASDNPEDKTISQILARLRYSGSETPDQKQGDILQDEALTLISGNLDASLFTPILSPVENYIRRTLHLDSFTINAGFLQNLYTEYTSNPKQFAEYTDMNELSSDIAKFSSSILLNNPSISMINIWEAVCFWIICLLYRKLQTSKNALAFWFPMKFPYALFCLIITVCLTP